MGLKKLGQSHVKYGVKSEYYPLVKAAMLQTIPELMGELTSDNVLNAWSEALDFVTGKMIEGAAKHWLPEIL